MLIGEPLMRAWDAATIEKQKYCAKLLDIEFQKAVEVLEKRKKSGHRHDPIPKNKS